jgi:hypothetical protein
MTKCSSAFAGDGFWQLSGGQHLHDSVGAEAAEPRSRGQGSGPDSEGDDNTD